MRAQGARPPGRPGRLWQQNHCGVYRSDDGGASWERLDGNGLPSEFGFRLALDPADPDTAFVIPEESAENRVTANRRIGITGRRTAVPAGADRRRGACLGGGAARGVTRTAACPTRARRAGTSTPSATASGRGGAPPAADPLGRSGARVAQWRSCSCPACSPPRPAARSSSTSTPPPSATRSRRCPSATSSSTRAARYGRSSTSSSTAGTSATWRPRWPRPRRSGSSPRSPAASRCRPALPDGGRDAGNLAVGDHRLDLVDLGDVLQEHRRAHLAQPDAVLLEPEVELPPPVSAVLNRLDGQEDGGIDAFLRAREDHGRRGTTGRRRRDPEPAPAPRPRSARRGRSRPRPGRSRSSRARSGSAPAPCRASPGRPSPASSRGSARPGATLPPREVAGDEAIDGRFLHPADGADHVLARPPLLSEAGQVASQVADLFLAEQEPLDVGRRAGRERLVERR